MNMSHETKNWIICTLLLVCILDLMGACSGWMTQGAECARTFRRAKTLPDTTLVLAARPSCAEFLSKYEVGK